MASLESAMAFIKTVKASFPNYKAFSDALMDFMEGNIDRETLILRVSALLDGHRDIAVSFNNFLPEGYKIAIPDAEENPTRKRKADDFEKEAQTKAVEFLKKVRKFSKNGDVYSDFLRAATAFKAHKDALKVDGQIWALFRSNPELYNQFTWFTADSWPEKYPGDGKNEDLSVFKRKTGKRNPKTGTTLEDYEDVLYESDMVFHSLESTKKAAERWMKKSDDDKQMLVKKYFPPMNMRCIHKLYAESTEYMFELLQSKPRASSSILLHCLKEKLEDAREWHRFIRNICANKFRSFHKR